MSVGTLLAFAAIDSLLVLTPGADWAYVIAVAVNGRSVRAAVAGVVVGYAVLTLLVVAGMAVLVARTPVALTGLTVMGAGYLVWLGGRLATRRGTLIGDRAGLGGGRRVAVQGAATSGLNPKGLLLFLALLPQFVRRSASWPVEAQMALLGTLHMLTCAGVYLAVGTIARSALSQRPRAAQVLGSVCGGILVLLGCVLLGERLVTGIR